MLIVAAVGVAGNGLSLWLLRHGQAESLNARGAFPEVLRELLGAAAVLVAAIVIAVTGYSRADGVAALLVGPDDPSAHLEAAARGRANGFAS